MNAVAVMVVALLTFNAMILVGTAYIVFALGHSGWWFALAVVLMAGTSELTERTKK